jgi:creatinine amidohydrolase
MKLRLEEMTSKKVKALIEQGTDIAVIPAGSVEQHGYHCPLGTDSLIARAVAQGVAERLNAICLPPLWYGVSPHHMDFAGSLTIRPEVLTLLIEDILSSLIHHGIKKILILNGHGGNTAAISTANVNVRGRFPEIFLAQSSVWLALHDVYQDLPQDVQQENWRSLVAHAGFLETSLVMAFDQNLVDLDQAVPMSVDRFVQATDPALSVTANINELTECGSAGDPTASNAEVGRMFLAKTVDQIVSKFDAALKTFLVD